MATLNVKHILPFLVFIYLSCNAMGQNNVTPVIKEQPKRKSYLCDEVTFTIQNNSDQKRVFFVEVYSKGNNGYFEYNSFLTGIFNKDSSYLEIRKQAIKRKIKFIEPDIKPLYYTMAKNSTFTYKFPLSKNLDLQKVSVKFRVRFDIIDLEEIVLLTNQFWIYK